MSEVGRSEEASFWVDWFERFEEEHEQYITPKNKAVGQELRKVKTPKWGETVSKRIWLRVYDTIEYRLSREWKTPEETIEEGVGDCEDVTFLIASMAAAAGISDNYVQAGYLIFPDGQSELHTWNLIGGKVMDGTGKPSTVRKLRYQPVRTYRVE